MMTRSLLMICSLAAVSEGDAMAAEPINKNPFTRPGYTADRPLPTNEALQEREDLEPLELKATLIAGRNRLANLSGEILAPGDEFRGYRLLRIAEGEVVLIREGESVTLTVHDESEEESR